MWAKMLPPGPRTPNARLGGERGSTAMTDHYLRLASSESRDVTSHAYTSC